MTTVVDKQKGLQVFPGTLLQRKTKTQKLLDRWDSFNGVALGNIFIGTLERHDQFVREAQVFSCFQESFPFKEEFRSLVFEGDH